MNSKQQFYIVFLGLFLTCIYAASPVLRRTESSTTGSQRTQSGIIQSVQKGATFFVDKLNKLFFDEAEDADNILISPINIYAALASLHLGADGETKEELSRVLGLPSNNEKLLEAHQEFGNLLKSIQNNTKFNEVRFGNGVYLQKGEQLKVSYVQQAKSYYDYEVSIVDFKNGDYSVSGTVNNYISEKTKGRIPQLFEEPIDPDTTILLATTLYFNGNWNEKFYAEHTKTENFNTGSREVSVEMMNQKGSFPYFKNDRLQIESLSLPYSGNDYSMIFVLPNGSQNLKDLVNKLTADDYQQIIKDTTNKTYVDIKIPRMKLRWRKTINEQLEQLGLTGLFQNANLGNMILNQNIAVSDVTHATEIEVDENGTVVTAVSTTQAAVMSTMRPKIQPIEFYVHRPFLFLIYSREANLILFSGLVQNPEDSKRFLCHENVIIKNNEGRSILIL